MFFRVFLPELAYEWFRVTDMTRRTKSLTAGYTGTQSSTGHTVSANAARLLLELAVSRGASRWTLAERAGIDLVDLQDSDNRIPFASYVALMRAGQELCNDPALALHFGEAADVAQVAFSTELGGLAANFAESLAMLNRYSALTVEVDSVGDRIAVERSGGEVWIVDRRMNPNDFPELTESFFARVVSTWRRMFGAKPFVKAVHVTHAAPPYRREYDRIFQVPIVFESDRNALLVVDEAFSFPRPSPSSRQALERLGVHAELMLKRLEASKTTRARVENLLIPVLPTGEVKMSVIARKLSVSRQTLFRRLKAEGVTFEEVLDNLRHRLALDYLSENRHSMKEIAYFLGFSDPAVFSRAFKRWTGSSPRAMRNSEAAKT